MPSIGHIFTLTASNVSELKFKFLMVTDASLGLDMSGKRRQTPLPHSTPVLRIAGDGTNSSITDEGWSAVAYAVLRAL